MNTPAGPDTLAGLLRSVQSRLREGGIESAELEAELLLRQALRESDTLPTKGWLYARLGDPVGAGIQEAVEALTARRLQYEPSAYITGVREFWGLDFEVTPDVLIPRPETELLVHKALEFLRSSSSPPGREFVGALTSDSPHPNPLPGGEGAASPSPRKESAWG